MSEALKEPIRERAADLGFSLCGFAVLQPPPHGEFLRDWLASGAAAEMRYIERGLERRLDPARILPGAHSIITVGFPYAPPAAPPLDWRAELRGRIAAYAAGEDYHRTMGDKLGALSAAVQALAPGAQCLSYVDTGAILEREWAHLGGVGWFGKNTMILHPRAGSWFFLGEILTDLEFDPEPLLPDRCGTCRRCLDLCPTGALTEGFRLDARLCISYLTIEHRGVIDPELRRRMGNWIFGCDVCQEVCPWNGEARPDSPQLEEMMPRLPAILALDEGSFRERFRHRAVRRAKRAGLLRNAAVALGNSGNPEALAPLRGALRDDPEPLVRGHAAWAIGELGGPAARAALESARRRDADDFVRAEAKTALDRLG